MGWGGARPGAGRKKVGASKPKPAAQPAQALKSRQLTLNLSAISKIVEQSEHYAREKRRTPAMSSVHPGQL